MTEPQLFAEPKASPPPQICTWCGGTPTTDFELERASYMRAANGTRVLRRHAIVAQACAACAKRIAPSESAAVVV